MGYWFFISAARQKLHVFPELTVLKFSPDHEYLTVADCFVDCDEIYWTWYVPRRNLLAMTSL